jgi:hypothetical protein
MAPVYTWLTLDQAVAALQGRLANTQFWTYPECTVYLQESLRYWNVLTETWKADFTFNATAGQTWYSTGTMADSPRLQTVTDSYIYTCMQYGLLEPPTGAAAWTGTPQFSLAELQYTLQRRRDEVFQSSGCNRGVLAGIPSTPNVRRAFLPDTVLEPVRTRFVPASGYGSPITLTREDNQAFDYFEPDYLQDDSLPSSWGVVAEPPLAFDVDTGPNVPGTYEVLTLNSGPIFAPPVPTLLGVPDDFSWLPKWGALADLLGRESEATDRPRAAYCLDRFVKGLKLMNASAWLLNANINGIPADTPSLSEQDQFDPEWQNDPSVLPAIVNAGIDFIGVCPVADCGVGMTLLGNAPVPVNGGDFIQCSREVFDVILSYAQRLAVFKQGGAAFDATAELEQDFNRAALSTNARLADLGIFSDVLANQGKRQLVEVPR